MRRVAIRKIDTLQDAIALLPKETHIYLSLYGKFPCTLAVTKGGTHRSPYSLTVGLDKDTATLHIMHFNSLSEALRRTPCMSCYTRKVILKTLL